MKAVWCLNALRFIHILSRRSNCVSKNNGSRDERRSLLLAQSLYDLIFQSLEEINGLCYLSLQVTPRCNLDVF
jgi:hypothetical protein